MIFHIPEVAGMRQSEVIKFLILRSIGNFLLLLSIFGVLATFGPALYYEVQYRVMVSRGIHYTVADRLNPTGNSETVSPGFGSILAGSKEQVIVPKDTEFSIVIPKIGASSKIFANVDASNENEFMPILLQGVAHAKGSVFPGMKGNIYLFAHSTDNWWNVGRYNAVFYLLKDVSSGDDVVIFFQNRRYNYKVAQSLIVDPSDVSLLVNSQKVDKEQLVLQTCWPPGTSLKRLYVIAEPKTN